MNYSKKAHMSTAALKDIIMKDARAHKKLREIVIEITDKCNYRCKFCYVHDATSKFMPIDTYKKLLMKQKN